MVEMERAAGEAVLVGPYTLRALTARQDEVVGALDGPGHAGDRHELTAGGRDRGGWPRRPERPAVPVGSPAGGPGRGRR
jgi:hypothetical protein